jgi:hypothetical protein
MASWSRPSSSAQWDRLELPVTPWGQPAFLLVGALSHSGRFRAVFCEQMAFGHLAEAMHQVLVGLGGTRGSGAPTGWPPS